LRNGSHHEAGGGAPLARLDDGLWTGSITRG
jgi:hypothetical protein